MKLKPHYSRRDVVEALRNLGISPGDLLVCSTSLGLLGLAEGANTQEDVNALFFSALREAVGVNGTLLVPTYSYTFCRSTASAPMTFDPLTTPSEIGPFPEYFRKQEGVIRSSDPLFSYAGIGPAAPELFRDLPHTSYGNDCLFDRLSKTDAKLCNIGIGTGWALFIHHVDWLSSTPFRYEKLFFGNILRSGVPEKTSWVYYVPIRHPSGGVSSYKIGSDAEKEGLWRYTPVGRGRIYVAAYAEYFAYMRARKAIDPWVTAQGPAGDPVRLEEQRVEKKRYSVSLSEPPTLDELARVLEEVPRECVSDGYDAALSAVRECGNFTVREFLTGTNAFSWIVPEKWTCFEGTLCKKDGTVIWSSERNVMPYSLSFEGMVTKDILLDHLHVYETLSDAAPRAGVYERDWSMCCDKEQKDLLQDEEYCVRVRTDFSYGSMKVAEAFLRGKSQECFLLCASLEGRGARSLAGVLTLLRVMRKIASLPGGTRYSYRLLLLPGAIGAAAWLSVNEERFEVILGGLCLEESCSGASFVLRKTVDIETECNALFQRAVSPMKDVSVLSCLPGKGSDMQEMFCRSGIPMLSLALPADRGERSADVAMRCLAYLESDFIPVPRYRGLLCLERFPELQNGSESKLSLIPRWLNGKRSAVDIAETLGCALEDVLSVLARMEELALIERKWKPVGSV